jgi:hypothetical protein
MIGGKVVKIFFFAEAAAVITFGSLSSMTISYLISSLLAYSFACLLASKAHLMLCA